jgi:hypothetical protein
MSVIHSSSRSSRIRTITSSKDSPGCFNWLSSRHVSSDTRMFVPSAIPLNRGCRCIGLRTSRGSHCAKLYNLTQLHKEVWT